MDIIYNTDLSTMNTFRMKVKAACLVEYFSIEELDEISRMEDLPGPLLHIGGGSNLLFLGDFPGTVLHSRIRFIEQYPSIEGMTVRVGAGVPWDEFCMWCAKRGLWGPENLSMVPGETGAAAVQNIGAYGREIGDIISNVECYDLQEHRMVSFLKKDCAYGYRDSFFKNGGKGRYVVTAVTMDLKAEYSPVLGYGNLRERIALEYGDFILNEEMLTPQIVRESIMSVRSEKLPAVEETGSAGSFFRNPYVSVEKYEEIAAMGYEKVPHFDNPDGSVKIPAAWLIEQCGWKGRTEGNAGVWPKQPLVLVNATGSAEPQEIKALEDRIIASVKEKFGIELNPEVEHI